MPGPIRLQLRHLKDGEELMLPQLKEGVAFTAVELLQVKDIFIKFHRRLYIVDLDCQMITPVDLHAHARRINQFTVSGKAIDSERCARTTACCAASIFSRET